MLQQVRFARTPLSSIKPLIGCERVSPEVLIGNVRTFAGEIIVRHFQYARVWRKLIADGPIAAVHDPAGSERLPQLVQCLAIEARFERDTVASPAQDS